MREDQFVEWLNAELDRRGWSRSEAARRGGFSASMMDKVIGGFANPGLDFCRGISRAFKIPLEDVFRLANILPPKMVPPELRVNQRGIIYDIDTEDRARRIMAALNALSMDDQVLIIAMIERLGHFGPRIIGEAE